jgi:hypothetical protein
MATTTIIPLLIDGTAARVPDPVSGYVSATLVPPTMGFLAVAIHFNGRRVIGLKTNFFRCNDDDSKGASVGDTIVTDGQGIARVPRLVTIGHYLCEIEDQAAAVVPTVHSLSSVVFLALPIGRHVAEYDDGFDFGRDADTSQ